MKIREWLEEGIQTSEMTSIMDKLATCVGLEGYLHHPNGNQHQETMRAAVIITLAINKYGLDFDTENLYYDNEEEDWVLKGGKREDRFNT